MTPSSSFARRSDSMHHLSPPPALLTLDPNASFARHSFVFDTPKSNQRSSTARSSEERDQELSQLPSASSRTTVSPQDNGTPSMLLPPSIGMIIASPSQAAVNLHNTSQMTATSHKVTTTHQHEQLQHLVELITSRRLMRSNSRELLR